MLGRVETFQLTVGVPVIVCLTHCSPIRIKFASVLSTTNATAGTVSYMAPECFCLLGASDPSNPSADGMITEKVDIYALGVVGPWFVSSCRQLY